MDKTDIVHACWKTKYRTENIEENNKHRLIVVVFFIELNVYIHEDVFGVNFVICGVTSFQ